MALNITQNVLKMFSFVLLLLTSLLIGGPHHVRAEHGDGCSTEDCAACGSPSDCDSAQCRWEDDDISCRTPHDTHHDTHHDESDNNNEDYEGLSPIAGLGVVAFTGIFAGVGGCVIFGPLVKAKLERKKRKHYRDNGDRVHGVVTGKSSRIVSGGENSADQTVYSLTVEVQSMVNGQDMRACKSMEDYIDNTIYNAVTEGGTVQVTTIASLTGDPRHFMLSEIADSDTKGLPTTFGNAFLICFGFVFCVAGVAGSFGTAVVLIMPQDIPIGIVGLLIALIMLIALPYLCAKWIEKKFEKEKSSPSGSVIPPRSAVELSTFQQQPVVVVQQPDMVVQPGVVVQQPVVVVQQPGVVMQQPSAVVPIEQPQATPTYSVPVPVPSPSS